MNIKTIKGFVCAALIGTCTNSINAQSLETPITLRGYGEVSAKTENNPNASILSIQCESEAKAKLVQAKYLSDMQLLPGVKKVVLANNQQGLEISDQGVVAAIRMGSKVNLISTQNKKDMAEAINQLPGQSLVTISSVSNAKVPMWLDRWDKYGFRFYYRPWAKPKGENSESYNNYTEFDFAEDTQNSGFVFWMRKDALDTGEGVVNYNSWEWAFEAANKKNLPIGLNLSTGSPGSLWFTNRYREQMAQKAPQFAGNFHGVVDPHLGATGFTSWNATTAEDATLGMLQDILREKTKSPNVTTILEPHGEPRHGAYDLLMEHGPVADATYRKYLKLTYLTTGALSKRWEKNIASWDEVKVPELAEFLGWGPQAIDLTGDWRIGYEKYSDGKTYTTNQLSYQYKNHVISTEGAPEEWFKPDFDDSAWPTFTAPGKDRTMFLYRRPAVYRQHINVPDAWLKKHKRAWIYVWDLNSGAKNVAKAYVNGTKVGESVLTHAKPHWMSFEVSDVLKPGKNTIALRLPKGYLAYRVYISPDEPKQYPNLGLGGNAQWCDFINWIGWSRIEMIKRGMEMIRQVDPNRQIDLMAPLAYANDVKKLALQYGGNFKDTGFMGVHYADALPSLMRGAQLPLSLEPGTPARNLKEFEIMMGLYATEGIQAIDYFIHIGSIMWDKVIRKEFEDTLHMIKLIGKYHSPKAEVAALYSTAGSGLTGYPWGQDLNTNLGSGYWRWNVRAPLAEKFESDAVTEASFENGDASRYKAIIDTNTSIMSEELVSNIEAYVRNGGTFITFVQTGRHTPLVKDTWPISRLTGYKVTKIDSLDKYGNPKEARFMRAAAGQKVFQGEWKALRANGLSLEKVSKDTQDLMMWQDGSVAIGSRKLGNGYIVQIGCKFNGSKIFDRIVSRPSNEMRETIKLFSHVLNWRGIKAKEYSLVKDESAAVLRHYVSNNGLYDIWVARNRSETKNIAIEVKLPSHVSTNWAWDVYSQSKVNISDNTIPVSLNALKYRVFMTPKKELASAALNWFEVQRNWWRGTAKAPAKVLPKTPSKFTLNLRKDWAFMPLDGAKDVNKLVGVDVKHESWKTTDFSVWTTKYPNIKHALLRKTFTIPENWMDGNPTLWIKGWNHSDFVESGRVWLDGKLISDWGRNNGVTDFNQNGMFKPGSTHTLAVEIKSKGSLAGPRANVYIWNWPKPVERIVLSGQWQKSEDVLDYGAVVNMPGPAHALSIRKTITIPERLRGKNIVVNIKGSGPIAGVITNGRYVRRFHHIIDDHFHINVTPFVSFGGDNEIEIIMRRQDGDFVPHKIDIKDVSIEVHSPAVYP